VNSFGIDGQIIEMPFEQIFFSAERSKGIYDYSFLVVIFASRNGLNVFGSSSVMHNFPRPLVKTSFSILDVK
jgi:hypothetical protein